MNKKQFHTAGHGIEGNNGNIRRHQFSNIIQYTNNISGASPSGINVNTHNTNTSNNSNKIQNQRIRIKSDANKGEGYDKSQTAKPNKNPRINELQGHGSNQIDSKKQYIRQSEQNKLTPVFVGGYYQSNVNNQAFTGNKKGVQTVKIQQKCVICSTPTQKCCGLCRKVFYCSSEHQQVDWHSHHKFQCQGRTQAQQQVNNQNNEAQKYNRTNNSNNFVFYSNNMSKTKPNNAYEQQMDYQAIHRFLELLQQRLILRSKIMSQAAKINQRTAPIVRQSLVKQAEQLLQLSERITHQQFKPSFSRKITKKDILEYSSQQWGSEVVVSENGVALQYYADLVLMAKLYHLCGMVKQARESIIAIGRFLEAPEQKTLFLSNQLNKHNFSQKKPNFSSIDSSTPQGKQSSGSPQHNSINAGHELGISKSRLGKAEDPLQNTKYLILQSILQLSEFYNVDKTSQSVYKLFIKKIEIEQGIWEQIYAYFNIGSWYMRKTYFDKSVKAFTYSLELLQSHRKGTAQSVIFKSDCLFNIGQGYWALGQRQLAIQNMQQSYRVRANTIGKNSMECSYCLFSLAKWYKELQKWSQCVQYVDQCLRIRKLYENQPNFQQKLEQIKSLISSVYKLIKTQKKKTQVGLDPKTEKYFSQILQRQQEQQKQLQQKKIEESKLLPQGTVASRLFREDKEYVKFKVNISLDLWNTISSSQAKLLGDLLQLGDQKMEKAQAIRILVESPFVLSLNADQREQFFAENKIQKLNENQ